MPASVVIDSNLILLSNKLGVAAEFIYETALRQVWIDFWTNMSVLVFLVIASCICIYYAFKAYSSYAQRKAKLTADKTSPDDTAVFLLSLVSLIGVVTSVSILVIQIRIFANPEYMALHVLTKLL